jgi:hypothetical protein
MTVPDAFSLTRLFITPSSVPPDPTLAQDWVGGVMTQWDAVSFANTVLVGPVTYRNLPVVSPNGLTEGTVLLAKGPAGYIVMGMLGTASAVTLIDPIRYRALPGDISLPNTTFADAGLLNFLVNENTQYAIDGALSYISTTSNDIKFAWTGPANMAVKWSMHGLSNATLNEILTDVVVGYGDTSPQTIQGLGTTPTMCRPAGWFATTDTPGLLQLRVALDSGTTAGSLQQGSWLRISELGSFGGANTFIKVYTATGSRSYDHSGNPIGGTDQDNNMYTWSLSGRSFGNEEHMWTFPGATMRTDLAGATILSAEMFLNAFAASSSPADLTYQWSTTSTIAATWPTNGFGGQDIKNLWSIPGWAGFDISSQMVNILTNNANSVLGGSYNFSDSATGFRGFGFGASTRPYIQVTYSI